MTKKATLCILAGLTLALGFSWNNAHFGIDHLIPGILMGAAVARGLFIMHPDPLKVGLYYTIPLLLLLLVHQFYSHGRMAGVLTLLWGLGYFGLVVKILRTPA